MVQVLICVVSTGDVCRVSITNTVSSGSGISGETVAIQAKGVSSVHLHWSYPCLVCIVSDSYMYQVSAPIVVGMLKPGLEWDMFLQRYVVMACGQNIL